MRMVSTEISIRKKKIEKETTFPAAASVAARVAFSRANLCMEGRREGKKRGWEMGRVGDE